MSTIDKPKTTPLAIPDALRARIMAQAEKDKRGVTAELLVLLEEALAAREKRK